MTNKTLYDEIIDFAEELTELIKQDWENSKKFIKEHKKYFVWLIVLVITMQFTDIMTLGVSWDKYCKLNGIQNGGDGEAPAAAPAEAPAAANKSAAAAAATAAAPTEAPAAAANKGAAPDASNKASASASETGKSAKTPKTSMLSKAKSGLKNSIKNNPVFGNMDKIFGAVSGMFTLIIFILVVVGILSLPVVIFIVITYCIIKSLLSRLSIL